MLPTKPDPQSMEQAPLESRHMQSIHVFQTRHSHLTCLARLFYCSLIRLPNRQVASWANCVPLHLATAAASHPLLPSSSCPPPPTHPRLLVFTLSRPNHNKRSEPRRIYLAAMLSTAPAAIAARATIMERLRFQAPAALEAEQQWMFSDEELLQTPSIVDGMSPDEEQALRRKSINFILQVGIMLKLPQTTMATAAVFFHRTLMRMSLVSTKTRKALHHYVSC